MTRIDTAVSPDDLDRAPAGALARLATEIRALHRRMHPADVVVVDVPCGVLAMGRHEVPALAMLFEHHDADPSTAAVAWERAVGYLATGRLERG
ncbi:hypothetical protein ACIA59_28230 [Micromonospora haikouensis]|uniref:hypothetical protein n=1 Tax=Micromonospora haikouensis TaxID=686309 RepID=UPI0037B64408